MSKRRCACGCGASLDGKRPEARYASDACRAVAWKARTGYRGENGRNGAENGSRKPSGKQVSYWKAREHIRREMLTASMEFPPEDFHLWSAAIHVALWALDEALPDRQCESLQHKEAG